MSNNRFSLGHLHAVSQHIALRGVLKPEDRALHTLLGERWSVAYVNAWRHAYAYRRSIRDSRVNKVFMFSYSRSGTHNFMSRLHYIPELFVFQEQAFSSDRDPWQSSIEPAMLRTAHYLALSMFGLYGIQGKKGGKLDKIVLFNNRYLEADGPPLINLLAGSDAKIIIYIRNIFRVLYSRDMASERVGRDKSKWKVTDAGFERDIMRHRLRLREIIDLHDRFPGRIEVVFNEIFCARPDFTFQKVANFLDVTGALSATSRSEAFFRYAFGHIAPLEVRDGRLWCNVRKAWVEGTGGHYNPLDPLDRQRSVRDPVENLLNHNRLQVARKLLSKKLTEHWINDNAFPYEEFTNKDLLAMIKKHLPD